MSITALFKLFQRIGRAPVVRLHRTKCYHYLLAEINWLLIVYRATACNATHGIAVAILSVCPSVRPSVRCVYCDKTKQRTANIVIPHETAITLVF